MAAEEGLFPVLPVAFPLCAHPPENEEPKNVPPLLGRLYPQFRAFFPVPAFPHQLTLLLKNAKDEIDIPINRKYYSARVCVHSVLPDSSGDGRRNNTWRPFHLKGHGEGKQLL